MAARAVDPFEDSGALPAGWARALVEERSSLARKLASSVQHEERLDFVRAVVSRVVSSYWNELKARPRSTLAAP